MNIYLDTEFIASFRKPLFGRRRHFIDLISIGLVDEAGRTYYAISKDFDLDYAWNDQWVRKNVLLPIHEELCKQVGAFGKTYFYNLFEPFTKGSLKTLLKWYGKTDRQIANDIRGFVYGPAVADGDGLCGADNDIEWWLKGNTINFYGWYADYDWVLFCSLFGRMIDLPKGFPMYCRDLKQMFDEKGLTKEWKLANCPDPIGEHNALIDAKWNKQMHELLIAQLA